MVDPQTLERFLNKHERIGLDSKILIYFLEGSPIFGNLSWKIFESIRTRTNHGICSTLSLLEILVGPYQNKNEGQVNKFYAILTTFPNLTWVDLTMEISDQGARLRSKYNLKTPDAILLATSLHSHTQGFISNDIRLKKVDDLDILTLQ